MRKSRAAQFRRILKQYHRGKWKSMATVVALAGALGLVGGPRGAQAGTLDTGGGGGGGGTTTLPPNQPVLGLYRVFWVGGFPGAENVWTAANGSVSGNWSVNQEGTTMAALPGPIHDLIFSSVGALQSPVSTVLGGDVSARSLYIQGAFGLNADGHTLTLSSGILVNPASTGARISSDIVLSSDQMWVNHSSSDFTVDGIVRGVANLTKAGLGTLNLLGANTFTGAIAINDGVLSISTDGNLGNAANGIDLNWNGTLRFNSAVTLSAERVIRANSPSGYTAGLSLAPGVTQSLGTGQLTGSGNLLLSTTGGTNSATLAIDGANSGYTGNLIIGATRSMVGDWFSSPRPRYDTTAGTVLALQNTGMLANAASITINHGSALRISQSSTALTGRLGSATALIFNSGRFQYDSSANSGAAINETFGAVTVTGQWSIAASATSGPTLGTTLNFGNLTRVDNATMLFRRPESGGTYNFGGAPAANSTRIFFANLTPDTTTSGEARSVVPWAAYSEEASGARISTFMTYDANGFRPLSETEVRFLGKETLDGAATGINVSTTQDQTIRSGGQSINSFSTNVTGLGITVRGGAGVNPPATTLTITSGAISTAYVLVFSNNAVVNAPNGAYIHLGGEITFNSGTELTGAGGVVVSSLAKGNTFYAAKNTVTGGLYIDGSATVRFSSNAGLGNDDQSRAAGNIYLSGGTLYFGNVGGTVALSDGGVNRAIQVNASGGTIGSYGSLNDDYYGTLQIPGTISGPGLVEFGGVYGSSIYGAVELTNSNANTYSGGTLVSLGTLRISNENQLGTGGLVLNGGILQAGADFSFLRGLTLLANSTIDTRASILNMVGAMGGSAGLTKVGAGTLLLSGANSYTGPTVVTEGTLALGSSYALADTGTLSVNGATAVLDLGANHQETVGGVSLQGGGLITGTGTSSLAVGRGSSFELQSGTVSITLAGLGSLNKTTAGTVVLSSANTFTGATTISAGVLTVTHAAAFNPTSGGPVTLGSGATLNYLPATDAPLGMHSSFTVNGTSSAARLGFSLGANSGINVSGAAMLSGLVVLDFYPSGGRVPGTYPLLQGGVGSSINAADYIFYNATDYTALLTRSATSLQVTIANATPLTSAYWIGGLPAASTIWAASGGDGTSNWAATANGPAQGLVPGAGTDVYFSSLAPSSSPNSTVLGAPMSVRSLTIGTELNVTGHSLQIGTGGLHVLPGTVGSSIGSDIIIGGSQTWNNESYTPLTVTGAVSGSGDFVKTGIGTVTFNSTSSTFSGTIRIDQGILDTYPGAGLGLPLNSIVVNPGGVLRAMRGATVYYGPQILTLNGTADHPSELSVGGGYEFGLQGFQGSGPLRLSVAGTSTQAGRFTIFGATAAFTGPILVGAPGRMVGDTFSPRSGKPQGAEVLRLYNTATLPNVAGISLFDGATLQIDQNPLSRTGRITSVPLAFHSSFFNYELQGVSGGPALNDTFGAVTATGVWGIVGSSRVGSSLGSTLNFGNLTRADHATLLFRSSTVGEGAIGGPVNTNSQRIFFANLTPDTTSSGTTRSVIPWAAASGATNYIPRTLMTYDANGFRPLDSTTEMVSVGENELATLATGVNALFTTGGRTIPAGGKTINSLSSSGSLTLSGSGSLTVTSGGVATTGSFLNYSTLVFPNGAYFHLGGSATIRSTGTLTGAGGVTVSSIGTTAYEMLFENSANSFTGGLYVNGNATVTFDSNNQLGNNASSQPAGDIFLSGGRLNLRSGTAKLAYLTQGRLIKVNESDGVITSGASAFLEIPGKISGAGQVQFGASSGGGGIVSLTNASANTYTGGTLISNGTLQILRRNQMGTGQVIFDGGTLLLDQAMSFGDAPILATSGTISTSYVATFDAGFAGPGSLTKIGSGTIMINGASNYAGDTTVSAGVLALGATGSLPDSTLLTINGSTAAFQLGMDRNETVRAVRLMAGGTIAGSGTSTLIVKAGGIIDLQSGVVSARLGGTSLVNKSTTGNVELSGANEFTGPTIINAGRLLVSGSISGSVTTVQSNGTLSVTGRLTTSADVTVDGLLTGGSVDGLTGKIEGAGSRVVARYGGGISPGLSADGLTDTAILRMNALAAGNSAHLDIQLGGTTAGSLYDKIIVDSPSVTAIDLDVGNGFGGTKLNLTLTGYTYHFGDKFFIIENVNAAGSVRGIFTNDTFSDGSYDMITAGGVTFAIGYSGDASTNSFTGGNDVVLMAVPEPGVTGALATGLSCLLGLARFRRGKRPVVLRRE